MTRNDSNKHYPNTVVKNLFLLNWAPAGVEELLVRGPLRRRERPPGGSEGTGGARGRRGQGTIHK